MTSSTFHTRIFKFTVLIFLSLGLATSIQAQLTLNESEYFEQTGVNYLVFSNWYNGMFGDSKMSGIELIHHGVRTATNGDVRLSPTPEQWDPIPVFIERKVTGQSIEAVLEYPDYDFRYTIKAFPSRGSLTIQLLLDAPLPAVLEGRAGLNMEFLPAAWFEKTFSMDGVSHAFPVYAAGGTENVPSSGFQMTPTKPLPLTEGRALLLSPENPETKVKLTAKKGKIALFDGRNKAQNGWMVARTLIPSGETGAVVEWTLQANSMKGWEHDPVIAHSQVGYHPDQQKVAVIELDRNSKQKKTASLYRVDGGEEELVLKGKLQEWGQYLRYNYVKFDFSEVTDPGTYIIDYDGFRSDPVLIGKHVYDRAWHPTLDVFMPVQMDHVLVNEAYRVWHGASHLDDALQAPVDHVHFDLYAQGPTTDTRFKPGEHIPGLNVGGWYDAGDYDIRTQSQYGTVMGLVQVWERFRPERDQTLVDYKRKYVDIHVPDGEPDLLQQVEHGAKALLAQHKAVGHAIPGIIVPTLKQYTHMGDGLTMTDNLIYNSDFPETQSNGFYSGVPDDRWAFTSQSTPLNYGSVAALAAAYKALKELRPSFARECLLTAEHVWEEEQGREPIIFRVGNTTGGRLEIEQLRAVVELLEATGKDKYRNAAEEMVPYIEEHFSRVSTLAVRLLPYMDQDFREKVRALTAAHKASMGVSLQENPFGVPITRGGWAGNGTVMSHAIANYYLYKAFPDIMEKEDIYSGLTYLFGCHPAHNISFVSGVGVRSKKVAYGMNRADYSYIPGGIVPGVLVLPPDFPENKEDWPFLWGENEYVIPMAPSYIFLVHAVQDLLNE